MIDMTVMICVMMRHHKTELVHALLFIKPARAARRARALRALGLLLADGAPTVGGGKTF